MPKNEAAGLQDNIEQMLDELNRTVNFYNLTHAEHPVQSHAPLVISGEYAGDDVTLRLLRSHSEYTIQPLTVTAQHPPGFSPAVYGGNLGLLLKKNNGIKSGRQLKNSGTFVDLNFLAARKNTVSAPIPIREFVIPPVVVLGIALIVFLFFVRSQAAAQTEKMQTDLNTVNRSLRLERAAVDVSAGIEKQINEITGKIQSLEKEREILTGKGGLSAIFNFITLSLPSGAYLKGMEAAPERDHPGWNHRGTAGYFHLCRNFGKTGRVQQRTHCLHGK